MDISGIYLVIFLLLISICESTQKLREKYDDLGLGSYFVNKEGR